MSKTMLALLWLLQVTQAPPALPPLHGGPEETRCPVGGERFSPWRASHYSIYGERPDGRPYSYLPFPLPVAECPSNKLIVFDTFSEQEVAQLARLIETPEYKRLSRVPASGHYRAYWLAKELDRPEREQLHLLLAAGWQASGLTIHSGAAERAGELQRYRAEFVQRARSLTGDVSVSDRLWIEARAANAARELGRFREAEALRQQAVATLEQVPEANRNWAEYLSDLAVVIERRDDSLEPLDMVPSQQVAIVCYREKPRNAFDRAACTRPEVLEQIEQIKSIDG